MRPRTGGPTGWRKIAAASKKAQGKKKPTARQQLTVIGGTRTRREVLPTTFRKIGIPTLNTMAVCRGDRWAAVVISIWSWAGEELGRERRESRSSFTTSAEAQAWAATMRARMERAPVDLTTKRITTKIKRTVGRDVARATMQQIFAANGRPVTRPPRGVHYA